MHLFRNRAAFGAAMPVLVVLIGAAGCSRTSVNSPRALAPEQVAPTLNSAFKDAKPEVKEAANGVVAALQSQDAPKAFVQSQNLTERPDLTPEQRTAAALSRAAALMQLQAAAANGNKAAEDLLQAYRASK